MSRRGGGAGGSNVATHTAKLALNLLMLLSVGGVLLTIVAGVLGKIGSNFSVNSTNPLYPIVTTWNEATQTAVSFIGPLLILGIGAFILLLLMYVLGPWLS